MVGIRKKLLMIFGVFIVFIAVISAFTIVHIDRLGKAVNVVLRENYRSVAACQDMKESLERIDSGILFVFSGNSVEGRRLVSVHSEKFASALVVELGNITLPGEKEKAEQIRVMFNEYIRAVSSVLRKDLAPDKSRLLYFSSIQPKFRTIKDTAQAILDMNRINMSDASEAAKKLAAKTHRSIVTVVAVAVFLALLFSTLARRWILLPITRLTDSVNEIREGNFDLVIETGARDEIGRLSEAFNDMASALRQTRKADRLNLMRTRKVTEEVFKTLPAAIALLDLKGRVEIATGTAEKFLGLSPGAGAFTLGHTWLEPLVRKAADNGKTVEMPAEEPFVQVFSDHREFFFQPVAVPIPEGRETSNPAGVALIMNDMTLVHQQRELKRGVLSTVSHQLKTPLTSLRMSIHLLLDEKVGTVNDKQAELLLAAREDSERLVTILSELLDLNRIESGAVLTVKPLYPADIARESLETFHGEAKDKGVALVQDIPDGLPAVLADHGKITHVFSNLISNALRFTGPGGTVTIRASLEQDRLEFSVADTGEGIAGEYLENVFDPFFRVPGQNEKTGVGLGLSIVKEIVHAHGGAVRAESVPGKGSVFHFTLPLES
jgi:signal transduction histidine kinase